MMVMSTATVQQLDTSSFLAAMTRGFRPPEYTTTTGHKLWPQDDNKVCVWCGGRTNGRESNEGVYYCTEDHWRAYVNLPEFRAFSEAQQKEQEARNLAAQQWRDEGLKLGERARALRIEKEQLQFDIGDWLVKGEDNRFCRDYKEAETITGYSVSSLRTFAYVARHVPACIRMHGMPWGAHQLVAPLKKVEDQRRVLEKAAAQNLPVSAVKKLVKGLPTGIVPKKTDEHNIAIGRSNFDCLNGEIKKYGPDAVIAMRRMNKWLERVGMPMTLHEEKAWDFLLPKIDRPALAEHIRKAAARLTSLAEKIESFQPAAPPAPPVQKRKPAFRRGSPVTRG